MVEGVCRQVRFIVIAGKPGAKKTLLAQYLKTLTGWRMDSLGDYFRYLYKESGIEEKRFDEWVAAMPIAEKKEIHRRFIEKNAAGYIILDMRYPEFLEGEQGIFTIYLDGSICQRAEWCFGNEKKKYPGLSIGMLKRILFKREMDEAEDARQMGLVNHDQYPYDVVILAKSETSPQWLVRSVLEKQRIRNIDLAEGRGE